MPVIDLGSVVGPQGPQGAAGATGAQGIQGNPGPNQVTDQTSTNLNGVLFGSQSRVTVKPVDSTPTADSTNLVSSGGTDKAIKGRVPVYGLGKNLLRNWYFGNPVNQRGQSSYSGQKYGIDGWKTAGDNSAVITINGGSITFAPSQSQSYFVQGLMDYVIPLGRTATISALIDGDLWATSFAIPSTRPEANAVIGRYNTEGNDGYIALVTDANADYQFQIRSPGITRTLYAFKLELGSEQTLCHNEGTAEAPVWVLNEIPDYEYELYRCMTSTADSSDTYANKSLITEPNPSHGPYTASGGTMDVEYFYKSVGELVYVTGIATPTASTGVAGISDVTFSDLPKNMDSTAPMFLSTNTCSVSSGDLRPAINIAYLGGKSVRFQGQATNNRPFQFGFVYS